MRTFFIVHLPNGNAVIDEQPFQFASRRRVRNAIPLSVAIDYVNSEIEELKKRGAEGQAIHEYS